MKSQTIFALCVLASGCTSVESKSGKEIFQSILGEKTLTTNALICTRAPESGISAKNQLILETKNKKCHVGETVLSLEEGDKVFINDVIEVKRSNLFKFQNWFIVGHAIGHSENVKFYYHWGMSTTSPEYPDSVIAPKWK